MFHDTTDISKGWSGPSTGWRGGFGPFLLDPAKTVVSSDWDLFIIDMVSVGFIAFLELVDFRTSPDIFGAVQV